MAEPWVSVALFRYSALPDEGWDQGRWDDAVWDGGLAAEGNWTDITCDVRGLDIQRGKRNVSIEGGTETGVLTLDLDNRDGQWSRFVDISLDQDGSAYVPALSAGVGIRVTSTDGTTTRWHFRGTIERWIQQWTNTDDVVTLTAVDGWARFAQQATVEWTPGPLGQSVAARMRSLLTRAGWDVSDAKAEAVYLQAGTIGCLGSRVVAYVETGFTTRGSVSQEVISTAVSDGGKAFLDGDGSFVYLNRGWTAPGSGPTSIPATAVGAPARPAQSVIPLFGDHCGVPGVDELPYSDLEWDYDGTNAAGAVVLANAPPPEVRDLNGKELAAAWSQVGASLTTPAGEPVLTLGDLRFRTQAEANALAAHYLAANADAYIAVRRLEVYPALDPRLWDIALGLRIGDHVRVLRREPQNTLDLEAVIEGIGMRLAPEPWRTVAGRHYANWLIEYRTSAASALVFSGGTKAKAVSLQDALEPASGIIEAELAQRPSPALLEASGRKP